MVVWWIWASIFWLWFGDYNNQVLTSFQGALNDLWRYDGNWAFVKGNETANAEGVLGDLQTPDPNAVPSARRYAACWSDNNGHLWVYGGLKTNIYRKSHILIITI
jgi:hypothetical protein